MVIDFNNLVINNLHPKKEFEKKIIFFLKEWLSDSKMVKVQTSGSTGTPKVFEIEKERMLNSAKMTCDFLSLKEGDSALVCLPVEYISGKMMIVRSMERKLNLYIKTPSSKPLEDVNQEIDFCAMSPLQVENSLEKIHLIKNLIIGGASVSPNLKIKIAQTLKDSNTQTLIYETYGMSETLSHIGLKQIYPVSEDYFSVFENVGISMDERGCLKISAPKLNPEILQTNDLVEIKNFDSAQLDKKKFRFLGRFDNVINSAGLKIFPEQLEGILKKQLSNELAFLGLEDEILGQKLILMIEGEETEELQSQLAILLKEVEDTFSKNHKPKEIYFLKNFPRITNGKLNRKELLNLL